MPLRWCGAVVTACLLGGCVQTAVLENDVRSAQWKARTLSTAVDPGVAYAALASQLIELEALYQRDPNDARVLTLLDRGYRLMAAGFVELRRLQALADGDAARADAEAALRRDAEARATYYRARLGSAAPLLLVQSVFAEADAACDAHDFSSYEARLHALSARAETDPEQRLESTLVRRLAAARLSPVVAARCRMPETSPTLPTK